MTRYSEKPAVEDVYSFVADLAEPIVPDNAQPDKAMVVAAALIELGEESSWAAVWWSYCALTHDLSDEALMRAAALLPEVTQPPPARAAALMLLADVRYKQAVYADEQPSAAEQHQLLTEAAGLTPDWPAVLLRLSRAELALGNERPAREAAARAWSLLSSQAPTDDPFDSAFTGRNLDRANIEAELRAAGFLVGDQAS